VEGDIKMDLSDTGWDIEWINTVVDGDQWNVLAYTVMNLRMP
jgi:hypothetical protein